MLLPPLLLPHDGSCGYTIIVRSSYSNVTLNQDLKMMISKSDHLPIQDVPLPEYPTLHIHS